METDRSLARLMAACCMFLMLPLSLCASHGDGEATAFRQVKIQAERLPDLNIARNGHATLMLNGEPTVIGGHTDGFIPTPTAEYYSDGQWHLMQMVYSHDAPVTVPLRSGRVLIAGGYEQHLGIGQTFTVETYDPAQHQFKAFGCLEQKRASAAGIEMPDGKIYITGNWYRDDCIECYEGQSQLRFVKPVVTGRYKPHLLRISADDVLILSGNDIHGDIIRPVVADRLRGDTLHIPLLDEWHLFYLDMSHHCDNSFIGDEQKGQYAYLLPVRNDDGQVAIMHVQGTHFSLLPTASPIPTRSQWGPIDYYTDIVVDRRSKHAYLVGRDTTCRHYVLCLEYTKRVEQGVPLTLYYTDPLPDIGSMPLLLDNGDLMMAGGVNFMTNDNYSPTRAAYRFPLGEKDETAATAATIYPWIGAAVLTVLVVLAVLVIGIILISRRKPSAPQAVTLSTAAGTSVAADESHTLLMQQLCQLMEQQQLFLRSDLKIAELAFLLGTNRRYVTDCIKATRGCSFSSFVNQYRITYAQRLLSNQPELKTAEIYLKSGFSNETSFYRTFRQLTGLTPNEWRARHKQEID